jgi:hypothetical protein
MLDGSGKATIPKAPKGGVTVYYGLTREDARDDGQQDLKKEHQKLVNKLKQQLNAIIANTKDNAAKQNAALQKQGLLGEAWSYTEAFLKGAAQGTGDLATTVLPQMTVPTDIENNIGLTIWESLKQGNTDPIKQDFHKLKSEISATAQDYQRLDRLLTDPGCLELLVNFPSPKSKILTRLRFCFCKDLPPNSPSWLPFSHAQKSHKGRVWVLCLDYVASSPGTPEAN